MTLTSNLTNDVIHNLRDGIEDAEFASPLISLLPRGDENPRGQGWRRIAPGIVWWIFNFYRTNGLPVKPPQKFILPEQTGKKILSVKTDPRV